MTSYFQQVIGTFLIGNIVLLSAISPLQAQELDDIGSICGEYLIESGQDSLLNGNSHGEGADRLNCNKAYTFWLTMKESDIDRSAWTYSPGKTNKYTPETKRKLHADICMRKLKERMDSDVSIKNDAARKKKCEEVQFDNSIKICSQTINIKQKHAPQLEDSYCKKVNEYRDEEGRVLAEIYSCGANCTANYQVEIICGKERQKIG